MTDFEFSSVKYCKKLNMVTFNYKVFSWPKIIRSLALEFESFQISSLTNLEYSLIYFTSF